MENEKTLESIKLMNKEFRDVISEIDDEQTGSDTFFEKLNRIEQDIKESMMDWKNDITKIYEFGKKYGRITKDCTINSCTTDEYPCAAKRPAYSVLSKDKIQTLLKIKIPEWQETLEKFIKSDRFLIK